MHKQHLSASRPSTVVSTSMARSSAPFGFSAKSTMRPASSICSGSVSQVEPRRCHHVRADAGAHGAGGATRCMLASRPAVHWALYRPSPSPWQMPRQEAPS